MLISAGEKRAKPGSIRPVAGSTGIEVLINTAATESVTLGLLARTHRYDETGAASSQSAI
jgi:hypothetical protein